MKNWIFLLFFIISSCKNEVNTQCNDSPLEMSWLQTITSQIESNQETYSFVSKGYYNKTLTFMLGNCNPAVNYQPVFYYCNGNQAKITINDYTQEKIIFASTDSNCK